MIETDDAISQNSASDQNEIIRSNEEKIENLKNLLGKSRTLIMTQKQTITTKNEEIEKLKRQVIKMEEMMEKYLNEEKPQKSSHIHLTLDSKASEILARVRIQSEIWCFCKQESGPVLSSH